MKRTVLMQIDVRPGNETRCGSCPLLFGRICKGYTRKDGQSAWLRLDRDGYLIRCTACKNAEIRDDSPLCHVLD